MIRVDSYKNFKFLIFRPSVEGDRFSKRVFAVDREDTTVLYSIPQQISRETYATQSWGGRFETLSRSEAFKMLKFAYERNIGYEPFWMNPFTKDIKYTNDIRILFNSASPPVNIEQPILSYPVGLDASYEEKYLTASSANGYGRLLCIFHDPSDQYVLAYVNSASVTTIDGALYNQLSVSFIYHPDYFDRNRIYVWKGKDCFISMVAFGTMTGFSRRYIGEFELNTFEIAFEEQDEYPTITFPPGEGFVQDGSIISKPEGIMVPPLGIPQNLALPSDISDLQDPFRDIYACAPRTPPFAGYPNTEQQYTAVCDGCGITGSNTVTIAAGTIVSFISQANADFQALQEAQIQAEDALVCIADNQGLDDGGIEPWECYAVSNNLVGTTLEKWGEWTGAWTVESNYTGIQGVELFDTYTVQSLSLPHDTLEDWSSWIDSWYIDGNYTGFQGVETWDTYTVSSIGVPDTASYTGGSGWAVLSAWVVKDNGT